MASGIYNYMPLGLKVLKNIEEIVREEMNEAGAQEFLASALLTSRTLERIRKMGCLRSRNV